MMKNSNRDMTTARSGLRRRSLLALGLAAVAPLGRHAVANPAPAGAIAIIARFDEALLALMRADAQTVFSRRFELLAPSVDQTFDLPAVLAVSVGPAWTNLPPDQKNELLAEFRRYTVASYVANFDNYAGQHFAILPETRGLGAGRVIVQTRLIPVSGDATRLDYVMQLTSSGWKAVDVLADGSISHVAVQRSDFRRILSRGGGNALLASLRRKTSDLSGGTVA
ncbi:ABC transporter substrate-binding protein [Rhodopila globiformis]|nr:ABC transporter substrate-binding protein [Rhodopila globiformis]